MDTQPRFSLHLIRGFRAAARHLSFTRAAAELCVTQSAISREVKALEEQLGQALFRRVNRSLQLTQAGEEFYRAVDNALALVDEAARRLAGTERRLAVTTSIPLASLWLVPRLARFTRRHAEIEVRIAATNDVVDLAKAGIDLAIRYGHGDRCGFRGEPLVDYRTFPVCAPALLRDRSHPLRTPDDLARHVLLEFETLADGRPWFDWDQWFAAMGMARVRSAGQQRFSHYDQVVQAALAGSGVAIGKHPHLNDLLREGSLCAPFGPAAVASLGRFYLVRAEATEGRGEVAAFCRWLRHEVRRDGRVTCTGGPHGT